MSTQHSKSNRSTSIKENIISAIISILVISIPFVLFIIPLSTKHTTQALESMRPPEGQWEIIEKDIDRDSLFTPEGNAKTEYTWGSNIENSTIDQFNSMVEYITQDNISNMQVTNNYYYSCFDNSNTCVITYTKDFNDDIGKHSVIITRLKDNDKRISYPNQEQYSTIVSVKVSEQPYKS